MTFHPEPLYELEIIKIHKYIIQGATALPQKAILLHRISVERCRDISTAVTNDVHGGFPSYEP